jgi:hypothetical protein
VLWFDLMFDVQVRRHRGVSPLPEETLASIAGYYRRVTTDASPMGRAVALVMVVGLVALVVQLVRGTPGRAVTLASLVLYAAPVGLAAARVFPNARRLGARGDPPAVQSALARGICRDHLACLASIATFLAVQLAAGGG